MFKPGDFIKSEYGDWAYVKSIRLDMIHIVYISHFDNYTDIYYAVNNDHYFKLHTDFFRTDDEI